MKPRRGITFVEQMVTLGILAVFACFMLPVLYHTNCDETGYSCHAKLEKLALGFQQYLQDNDGHWPLAVTGKNHGWANEIRPYKIDPTTYICPLRGPHRSYAAVSYWYNRRLSGISNNAIATPAQTLVLGEGSLTRDMGYSFADFPTQWLAAPSSPLESHLKRLPVGILPIYHSAKGARYLFADGHDEWLQWPGMRDYNGHTVSISFVP